MSETPTEIEKKLFRIFKDAIEAERSAQNMYLDAMRVCGNAQLKHVFQTLHEDETRHERELMQLYGEHKRKFGEPAE